MAGCICLLVPILCLILLSAALWYSSEGTSGVAVEYKDTSYVFEAFTVASEKTDGYKRFSRSAKYYEVPVTVLGMGQEWKGGNMKYPGGGYKINLLKKALEPHKDDQNLIVLFTDSYDLIFLSNVVKIMNEFLNKEAGIIFSAEFSCWPDSSLTDKYPTVESGYRFLNSGGFIGFAPNIYKLLTARDNIDDVEDDQLYYTLNYLNSTLRNELNIKLDTKAEIFQNLNLVSDDVRLEELDENSLLQNVKYKTYPMILHGNGVSKLYLNSLANYLSGNWNQKEGCIHCQEDVINLDKFARNDYPTVLLAVFIEKETPFLEEFMKKLAAQEYPKKKIHVFLRNSVAHHKDLIQHFITKYTNKYSSIKLLNDTKEAIDESTARDMAMDMCVSKKCDFYFSIDSEAHLDHPDTLTSLIQQNRSVIAPMLYRPFQAWSNFWGAINSEGYYKRSFDYMDIVTKSKRGLWNVPFVNNAYLINASIIVSAKLRPVYKAIDNNMDFDMVFCKHFRDMGVFMYVDNRKNFGHLINAEKFNASNTNPEIYQLMQNRWDWEQRYLSSEYDLNFKEDKDPEQPCPDVYWFPIVSVRFCFEFIEIMEAFGNWSDGSNNDNRLQGGYEAVPTRDIHMNQVGLDEIWLEFLKLYVKPLQEKVFIGYHHDAPRSLMNFVVRYKPDEQPSLRPHHDSSTYTINIALNTPNIDYEGGGCKFIRYNCQVTDMRLGWMLMHPGRLTHFHEGLQVTKGTRYIMISFVDP